MREKPSAGCLPWLVLHFTRAGDEVNVSANKRHDIVDRRDTVAGDFLIDEFRSIFVEACRSHANAHAAFEQRDKLDSKEFYLAAEIAPGRCGYLNVKHLRLRRSSPTPYKVPAETTELCKR